MAVNSQPQTPLRQRTDLGGILQRILEQFGPMRGAAVIVAALTRDARELRRLLGLDNPPRRTA